MGIKELAEYLNISIATVSRALNGKDQVSPKTRQAVLEAAVELGYTPNQSGRSLRKGSTGLIAAVIPVRSESPLADSIFMTVLDGLRAALAQRHLDLVILLSGRDDDPFEHMRRIVERGIADGIVLTDTLRHDRRIDYLLNRRLPFVTFGRSLSGGTHPWIDLDFKGAAEQAVERLVGLGHRRIALATTAADLNYSYLFIEAYIQALHRRGLPFKEEWVIREKMDSMRGYRLCDRLLALYERPSAVVLVDSGMAVGLYRRLDECGLRPGTDMAIVGFIESPQCQFLSPSLSYFKTPLRELGVSLGEALLMSMDHPTDYLANITQTVWPTEFMAGESDQAIPGAH